MSTIFTIATDAPYIDLTQSHKDSLEHLGRVVWAADLNVGSGANNGPEYHKAWNEAEAYLRSLGLSPIWE